MAERRIAWLWFGTALLVVALAGAQMLQLLRERRPASEQLARERIQTVLLRAGLDPERYEESLRPEVIRTHAGELAVAWVGAYWDAPRAELYKVQLGTETEPTGYHHFRVAMDPPAGRGFTLQAARAAARESAQALLGLNLGRARFLDHEHRLIHSGSLILGRELFWRLGDRRVRAVFSGDRLESLELTGERLPLDSHEGLPLLALLFHLFVGLVLVVLFSLRLRRRAIVSRAAFALAGAAVLIPTALLLIQISSFPLKIISVGSLKASRYTDIESSEELRACLEAAPLTATTTTMNMIMVAFVVLVLFVLVLVPVGFAEACDWEREGHRFRSLMALLKRGHLIGPEFAVSGAGAYAVGALLFGVDMWAVFGLSGAQVDLTAQALQAAVSGGFQSVYFFGLQGMLSLMVPTLFWALGGVALVERLPVPRPLGLLGLAAVAGISLVGYPGSAWLHSASWILVLSVGLVKFDLLALLFAPLLERAMALGLASAWIGTGAWPTTLLSLAVLAAPLFLWTGLRRSRSRRAFASLELAPEFVRRQLLAARYAEDRQIGWSIHRQLLPQAPPQTHLAAEYFHRQDVGREFFTFISLDARRIGIALGEVDGEGLQAALWMTVALSALKGKARRYPEDCGQVLESLNAFLLRKLAPLGAHVGLVYGVLDLDQNALSFANAGYIEPRLSRGNGWHALGLPGPALGSDPGARYPSERIELETGDRLLFSSNWFLEQDDSAAAESEAMLDEALQRCQGDTPDSMARTFLEAVLAQAQGQAPEVTVVCAHI